MNHSRRRVLKGAAGFTLALPFLPSLAPARAAAAVPPRRLVAIATRHGGVATSSMYPAAAPTDRLTLFQDHEIRWGRLQRQVDGGAASLSAVLRGRSDVLTDRLVAKMNVIRGLDIPFWINHHEGGHLGNYASHAVAETAGEEARKRPQPTIDQVMAWSRSFYPDLTGIRERSLVIGTGSISHGYSSPQSRTGTIVPLAGELDARRLFDRLFGGPAVAAPTGRKPVVDRVLATYRALRDGDRRLSAADRQRLDDHMERLSELERRVNALAARPGVSCSALPPAADSRALWTGTPADQQQFYAVMNDLIVAAFLCDVTRIVTMVTDRWFSSFSGDWHKDVAHQAAFNDRAQATLVESKQRSFEAMVLDLAAKLDVPDATGGTVLDGSLVMWTQESGKRTHRPEGRPVVTFGSARGFFQTGLHVDYQHPTRRTSYDKTGLLHGQFLANALLAMGVPAQEWKRPDNWGYGIDVASFRDKYLPGVFAMADQKLPILT